MANEPVATSMPSPAPVAVQVLLKKAGYMEIGIGIPGAPPWWTDGGGGALPWDAVLDRIGTEIVNNRQAMKQVLAASPKHWARSSEFWVMLAGTAPMVMAAVAAWGDQLKDIPSPWDKILGGVCTILGAVLPLFYAYIRQVAKSGAENEKAKIIMGTEATMKIDNAA